MDIVNDIRELSPKKNERIMSCYGVEANLELSNGQTITLGDLRHD